MGDTVSDLALRYLEITQDLRLYRYTASVISLGLEANRVRLPGRRWSLALFSPVTLALFATVIGVRNEYGDGDAGGDLIRIYLVYALASVSLFLFFAFASAPTGPVWAIFHG